MLTVDQFTKAFPENQRPQEWVDALNALLPKYGIDTPERLTAFLAQCGHESAGFTVLQENLNYSAAGLLSVWPKRFDKDTAKAFARKPEVIANYVYANRLGNGPVYSGDGWRYRGRGVIQITGKANYLACANAIGKPLEEMPDYLETVPGAVESACWYWQRHSLNALADAVNVKQLTRAINGGLNGLADRYQRTEEIREVLTA